MTEAMPERQAFKIESPGLVSLLCWHCGEPAIHLTGYGVIEYAGGLRGRVICAACDERRQNGEALPICNPVVPK